MNPEKMTGLSKLTNSIVSSNSVLKLDVGPKNDIRTFNLTFPKKPCKIGVLVSGGADSAILYYLMVKVNLEKNLNCEIIPYTKIRPEDNTNYATSVVNYVQDKFNIKRTGPNIVGNDNDPPSWPIKSAIDDALKESNILYLAIISSRPEHSIGFWPRPRFVPTLEKRYPMLYLEKSHVIDLYIKFNVLDLLKLTNSCRMPNLDKPCGYCNGCKERAWGLKEMSLEI